MSMNWFRSTILIILTGNHKNHYVINTMRDYRIKTGRKAFRLSMLRDTKNIDKHVFEKQRLQKKKKRLRRLKQWFCFCIKSFLKMFFYLAFRNAFIFIFCQNSVTAHTSSCGSFGFCKIIQNTYRRVAVSFTLLCSNAIIIIIIKYLHVYACV